MHTPQYFKHQDGGLYEFVGSGIMSETKEPMAVYKHLWPFESQIFIRPLHEWSAPRFEPISAAELGVALQGNRIQYQEQVRAHKAARQKK